MRRFVKFIVAIALAIGPSAQAAFAGPETTGVVRIFVGTPPGSAVDSYARIISEQLKAQLHQTVIVENKPGATNNIAAHTVLQAPADGLTIWVGTQTSMLWQRSWHLPDFIPLIKGVEAPLVLVTSPTVPAKDLKTLVPWIKANEGKASYASFGPGTPSQFLGFEMNHAFGLDMTNVPYGGSGHQTTAIMSGQVPLGFDQVAPAVPQIKAGKLHAIAVTGAQRFRLLPDVPTFAELGHPNFRATIWFGLFVRSGTPKPALDRLLAAVKAAHAAPEAKRLMENLGFDVVAETGPAFRQDIDADIARWRELAAASHFKLD